ILNEKPCVQKKDSVSKVIIEISSKRLGMTAVLDGDTLVGIITDGDLRRMLLKGRSIENTLASDIMSENPKYIQENALAVEALELMRSNHITQAIVVDEENTYCGVIHLHDLLKEGII
ncbi:MAG: CBS domain-containing protein, partial [Bacteroidales bacterium]